MDNSDVSPKGATGPLDTRRRVDVGKYRVEGILDAGKQGVAARHLQLDERRAKISAS
jgi:hypothetical protein